MSRLEPDHATGIGGLNVPAGKPGSTTGNDGLNVPAGKPGSTCRHHT
jgi:hypothetical protein